MFTTERVSSSTVVGKVVGILFSTKILEPSITTLSLITLTILLALTDNTLRYFNSKSFNEIVLVWLAPRV